MTSPTTTASGGIPARRNAERATGQQAPDPRETVGVRLPERHRFVKEQIADEISRGSAHYDEGRNDLREPNIRRTDNESEVIRRCVVRCNGRIGEDHASRQNRPAKSKERTYNHGRRRDQHKDPEIPAIQPYRSIDQVAGTERFDRCS
ncbi:MAG: hypothetical protein DYH05_04245 [Acidobacteria bacterium ACB1]|nr:hypothetical protein [Acidobacteria bacterium ACB1]